MYVCEECGIEDGAVNAGVTSPAEVRPYHSIEHGTYPVCSECKPVRVMLTIDNEYEDGHEATTTAEADVTNPYAEEDRDEWEQEYLFPHTGTGYGATDPETGEPRARTLECYSTVTITAASDPLLVGITAEFGG